jgi:hypothetical protein
MSEEKAKARIKEVAATLRRKRLLNVNAGEFKSVINAIGNTQDYFIPTKDGKGIEIDLLPQNDPQRHIDDIEYFKKKAIESLKVPANYLSYIEGGDASKSLANTDIRWARRIRRIQGIYRDHLTRVLDAHFKLIYQRPVAEFKVMFASVSALEDQARLEALEIRASVAAALQDYYSQKTILTQIFGVSDDEAEKYINALDAQQIDKAAVASIAEANAEQIREEYFTQPEEVVEPVEGDVASGQLSTEAIVKMFKENTRASKSLREAAANLHTILNEKKRLEVRNKS